MLVVPKSKYDALVVKYSILFNKWDSLVDRINDLGGEDFLDTATSSDDLFKQNVFSQDELRKLIQLCHPDKHDGKQIAQDMTSKLNGMRK